MPKTVALITACEDVAVFHARYLRQLFQNQIELECYSYERTNISQPLQADLAVVSIYPIYLNVKKYIPKHAKTIIVSNTITNAAHERIAGIPAGTAVMLVNYSIEMTMDTIALFHQLGLDHLDYVPIYPGVASIPDLDIAITPGEPEHVPASVEQVIDIGHRVLDANTIIDMAMHLELDHLLKEERFIRYFQSIRINKNSVSSLFDRTNVLEGQLNGLLDVMDDGIIVIEDSGIVHACNKKAQGILEEPRSVAGRPAAEVLPQIPFDRVFGASAEIEHRLLEIKGQHVSVKVVPVLAAGQTHGALAIVNRFDEKEKDQHKLRSQLLGKGHKARFTFDSILTRDGDFEAVKSLARKKARSEASILISGESGTGKELFAHALHNASARKEWQFVAINCAALPESLLESELFGYEEGAFTGARKGGKIGLFELAHKGTLFLDEIGELHLNLQARLLRVLEAREVMRIGGDRVVHVDTRIIAATNKDLWNLVEEGKFRKDLYYRLNVLPIRLPPLRERKDDIPFLFDHLKKSLRADFALAEEAKELLVNHPWYGNVRELKNCVEYLGHLEKSVVDVKDLAGIIGQRGESTRVATGVSGEHAEFLRKAEREADSYIFVLESLQKSYRERRRAGRRSLLRAAQDQDLFLTEAQIRKMLALLEEHGFVRLANGRGGTTVIPAAAAAGLKALRSLSAS
jgi:sigma-54 dependent transcriptional regulator, acetoin dehydrogenase operon transcriptional activator AcoR